jgi:hypothetical protein
MKTAGNSVANFDPRYSVADCCDFAGAIGQRHHTELRWTATAAVEDHQVSVVGRACASASEPRLGWAADTHSIATRYRQGCQSDQCDRLSAFSHALLRRLHPGWEPPKRLPIAQQRKLRLRQLRREAFFRTTTRAGRGPHGTAD